MTRGGQNTKDMAGRWFGQLHVLHRAGSRGRLATWKCECPCGAIFTAVGADLRRGKTKTCGCRTAIKSRRNWQGYKALSKTYWRQVNQGAAQRGIPFRLSIQRAWLLFEQQGGRCALSGLPLSLRLDDHTASLDRIDSTKGYTASNVQWVHRDVNKLKGGFSVERLRELCKAIVDYGN